MTNKKLLKEFKKFKDNYKFSSPKIIEDNGNVFCNGELIKTKEGNIISETETLIDVGYKNNGALPKLLSNLFEYKIKFKGKKLHSIESFFQGIKFKNKKIQNLVFKYSGISAVNIKFANQYDWTKTQCIFWQGKKIDRHSCKYKCIVDELYISAIKNPLYKQTLLNAKNKTIIHSIGNEDESKTVFSRQEFEFQLNCLKDFLLYIENKKIKK